LPSDLLDSLGLREARAQNCAEERKLEEREVLAEQQIERRGGEPLEIRGVGLADVAADHLRGFPPPICMVRRMDCPSRVSRQHRT